ncbi:MAG: hypothetical protein LUH21_26165 [Clostridiales bacterium]|nr:hypothetical protein [Clostridiales bacterium]
MSKSKKILAVYVITIIFIMSFAVLGYGQGKEGEKSINSIPYGTILTCRYPDNFVKKRDNVLSLIEGISSKTSDDGNYLIQDGKSGYKMSTNKGRTEFVYFGKIKNGKPSGQGVLCAMDTEMVVNIYIPIYAGAFKEGKYNGYGISFDQYGIKEEGEYKDGKLSGEGIKYFGLKKETDSVFKNGTNIRENYFDKKLMEGGSILIDLPVLRPSVLIEGKFKAGLVSGKKNKWYYNNYGTVKENGYKYYVLCNADSNYGWIYFEGEMDNDEKSGQGKEYYSNQQLHYVGMYKKDEWSGKGTLYNDDGSKLYVGEFKKALYHGKGTLYNRDGSVAYKGKFKNGEIK